MQRRRLLSPAECGPGVLLCLQRRTLEPRERVLEVAPDPFEGVELGTIGRQAHETHVVWEGQALGGMRPTVVQE